MADNMRETDSYIYSGPVKPINKYGDYTCEADMHVCFYCGFQFINDHLHRISVTRNNIERKVFRCSECEQDMQRDHEQNKNSPNYWKVKARELKSESTLIFAIVAKAQIIIHAQFLWFANMTRIIFLKNQAYSNPVYSINVIACVGSTMV